MIIATLLLSFFLNIVNHGNIFIAVLNTLLLFLSIYVFLKFTHRNFDSPLMILVGAIPVFTKANNILIICFAIGLCLLILFYLTTKFKKISTLVIAVYILFVCLYANGLIKPPFVFQAYLLIFNDDWTNLYITQMKTESQYMPYLIRSMIFNQSAHFYVLLSKLAGLFTLKNLYGALLIMNIYPLVKGLTLDLKSWNKSKTLLLFCVLLISLSMVVSRKEEINNTYLLLSPFLTYFILKGLNSVNKKIYFALLIISIVIATGP